MVLRSPIWFAALFMAFFAVAGMAVPTLPVFGVKPAEAQEKKRKNLFQLLFERRNKRRAERRAKRQKVVRPKANTRRSTRSTTRNTRSTTRRTTRRAAPKPVVPKIQKNENAVKVLVVGDFMADGIAWGLNERFADDPNIVFIEQASGLSGLVRDDVVDWPGVITGYIEESKPAVVLVVVGMNDRQQMRLDSGRVDKLTAPWKKAYEGRVETLAGNIRKSGAQLIWMGLPPVRSGSMNSDYLVFNEVYRSKVEAIGGTFIDVWDGYTNEEGAYVSAGPDINGQIVRLRSSDGINMTRAGKRKLAFYAEKDVRSLAGLGAGFFADLPGTSLPTGPLKPEYDPAKTGKTILISLDSAAVDGGSELEGAGEFLKDESADASVSHQLVAKGVAAVPQPGRVDSGWGLPEVIKKEDDKTGEKNGENADAAETGDAKTGDDAGSSKPNDQEASVGGTQESAVAEATAN